MKDEALYLLKSLFACDKSGAHSIRVVIDEPKEGEELQNAIVSHSTRSLENLLKSAIVIDEDGNPALRLSAVKFGTTLEESEKKKQKGKTDFLAKNLKDKEVQRKKRLSNTKK